MSNGYLLWEGPSALDGSPIIMVATGTTKESVNPKTGPMIQTWILTRDVHPHEAAYTNKDVSVCGDCPLRANEDGKRGCYVQTWQAPTQVWKTYHRQKYPPLPLSEYQRVFGGKAVRLGSYGDPAAVPREILEAIVGVAKNWTGYTHQWASRDDLKHICMASTDTLAQTNVAHARGWRTFRLSSTPMKGEIVCPASKEAGFRTTCHKCNLCSGSRAQTGVTDIRKSIVIAAHGAGAKTATLNDARVGPGERRIA